MKSNSIFSSCTYYCAYHVLVQPNFWRYYFFFLPDQANTHLNHFNALDGAKFQTNQTTGKEFPPRPPIVKIGRFRQCDNIAESSQFLQWGSMGKFFICCRIQLKFRLRVRLKPLTDRDEFELD